MPARRERRNPPRTWLPLHWEGPCARLPSSMPTPADSALWTRRFLWLLLGLLVWRVVYLWLAVDFELAGDEAYYWDWGRRPDWCYYSKPPLIGWIMGLLRCAFGYNWWAVRLTAAALAACTLTMIFLLGRALYDARTGFFAACLMLLTPAFTALSVGLTIDAPLMFCWSTSLLLFWRAISRPSPAVWLGLTLLMGVGVLAKQMMLVFPLLMLAFALANRDQRHLMRSYGFWGSILGALLFMAPVIVWNVQHDWITAKHTAHHFQSGAATYEPSDFLAFLATQAGFYSMVSWGLALGALGAAIWHWRLARAEVRFLVLFSAPGLAVVAAMALRQHVNENWAGVYYVAAFVLAAATAPRQKHVLALWVGGTITLAVHAILPLLGQLGIKGAERDPVREMRGFSEAGARIGKLLDAVPRPAETFVYVLGHRYNASQLAFHLPQHPTVFRWCPTPTPESQYEVWPGAQDKLGWDALIIDPLAAGPPDSARLPEYWVRRNFQKLDFLATIEVPLGPGGSRSFNIFLGRNMLHWPDSIPAQTERDPKAQLRNEERTARPQP